MVNGHLQVSIYVDQPWSMLIDLDHMLHENNRLLDVSINHRLTLINLLINPRLTWNAGSEGVLKKIRDQKWAPPSRDLLFEAGGYFYIFQQVSVYLEMFIMMGDFNCRGAVLHGIMYSEGWTREIQISACLEETCLWVYALAVGMSGDCVQ